MDVKLAVPFSDLSNAMDWVKDFEFLEQAQGLGVGVDELDLERTTSIVLGWIDSTATSATWISTSGVRR